MAEFIEILSPSALKELQTANLEILSLIKNIDKAGDSMKNIKTPSGSDSAVKGLNNSLIQQEKLLQNQQKALEKARLSEIKLQQAREKSFDTYDKNLTKEQAKLNASQNIYNKVQQKLNALSNEYKALAVQKELTGKLTDSEAKRYDFLLGKITKYDTTLKAVDATMGKHQRNVGNYASGFNPLSNSINQLTREMPAFANSVQTGFMAISNNLPIFFDAMQGIIAQNKILQAQGQPTTSVLKQLAGSFLSVGTALSIGVTLLTVFGDEIVDAIFNTKAKAKADEEAQKAIEDKNKAEQDYIDTMRKAGGEEISRSKILMENASNVNLKMRDRLEAIKQLKERYPDYLGHLTNEQFLSGKTAEAEERLNDALMKRGIAIALQSKLTEKYNELSGVLLKINDIQSKSSALSKQDIDFAKKLGVSNSQLLKDKTLVANLTLSNANREKKSIEEQIKGIFDLYNKYSPYLSAVRESTEAVNIKTKAEKSHNEELKKTSEYLSKENFSKTIAGYKEQLSLISKFNPAYSILETQLKNIETLYEVMYGTIKKGKEEVSQAMEIADEDIYTEYFAWLKLKEATDEYLKTISSDAFNKAFNNIGLSSAKMFLDFDKNGQSTFDKLIEGADTTLEKFAVTFQAVGDLAQDVFSKMNEMSNQRFENEKANLQKEKEIALMFAGESSTARAEIERQYEIKQREIKNREAKAKKQQAIFNISIDIAQGIISALATGNIPLSIAIGAIGAVQLAMVAAQQIPQYWEGTDNHKGGAMMVNDQKGSTFKEIVQTPDGKMRIYNERNKILNAPKGTKVFTASESAMMFDNNLNSILANNGISNSQQATIINVDVNGVIEAINNKPSVSMNIDKNGLNSYVRNGHTSKEITNKRINGQSYGV